MSKYNFNQSNFSYGEIGPQFLGRKDLKEYNNGLEQLENLIVQKQGGLTKRPGSSYISTLTQGKRLIPFIFSKNESYAVILNQTYSTNLIEIYKADGTASTVDQTGISNLTSLAQGYDPSNWKFSQNGDILVLSYSSPDVNRDQRRSVFFDSINSIAPIFIIRLDTDNFIALTFSHPITWTLEDQLDNILKFAPAVHRPYLNSNVDPNIRLYVSSNSVGSGRTIYAVDSSNTAVPFFALGHSFTNTGSTPGRIGAYFRLQKGGEDLVCFGDASSSSWSQIINSVPSGNIDSGTDILTTSSSHNLSTRDIVRLNVSQASGTTDPVISGHSFEADPTTGNPISDDFYVRVVSATQITLHPTQADADANTNIVDFTTAGDRSVSVEGVKLTSMPITIVEATSAALASAADATDDWKESAWSAHRGFPRSVINYEQRLFFGGTKRNPGTLWGSQVGNILNFMQTRLEQDSTTVTLGTNSYPFVLTGDPLITDPVDFTIASEQANIIQWMKSFTVLTVGTLGAEYIVSGGDSIISKDSIFVKKQTEYGSNNAGPITNGNSTLYVSRDGRRVMEFKYNDANGSYLSTNLSLINEFMVFKGYGGTISSSLKNIEFKELHYQPNREVVWLVTTNNELVGMTYSRETETVAWHYCPTRSGDKILSAGIIYNSATFTDELWVIAQRSINGSTVTYLEKIGDDFEHPFLNNTSTADGDIPIYSDSAIVVTLGSSTNVVTGLTHLEGEVVNILAGATVESQKTVSSGQVTLDATYDAGTRIVVGLPYTAKLKSLDINAGSDFGSSDGNRQRNDRVAIRLYNSQGGDYGVPGQATLFPIEYDASTLFTGIKRLFIDQTPDMESKVYIEHSDPTPFNILSMTYRGVAYD